MSNNYDLITIEAISQADSAKIIADKEKNQELTYREEKVREYLKKFQKLDHAETKKAQAELLALEIPRLGEEHIVKILELMPANGTELRAIVSHSGTVLVDENMTKIIEVLNNYRK
ncbi:MAG: hypothetical protein PF569_03315 [Candidatus Woesearchaeota archaeon]|jgi:DNA-directed RNA polymerase subunit F|nr:hypothetical protein [Candidatus Woesearchaeota archaeon]